MKQVDFLTLPDQDGNDHQYAMTPGIRMALSLRDTVLAAPENRIGMIVGDPGTGKTIASKAIVGTTPGAMRIVGHPRMDAKSILKAIYDASGVQDAKGTTSSLMQNAMTSGLVKNKLIVLDEANQLLAKPFEVLRLLSDEAGAAVICIGTLLFRRYMVAEQATQLMKQFMSRVGPKSIDFRALTTDQLAMYLIIPRFGKVNREIAAGWHQATGGNLRQATELAWSVERVMKANNLNSITTEAVQAAIADLGTTVAATAGLENAGPK